MNLRPIGQALSSKKGLKMADRGLLLSALKTYKTDYASEQGFIQEMINFIENNPNCFERSNLSGHVNGSAWVLSPDEKKVLLTHHKKLNRWLQLGGHSDGGDNTWNVALREATEESGIQNIQFVMKEIFDIDIHTIPANAKKNEPEHKHYDVRFLLKAPTEKVVISDESNSLKWINATELSDMARKGEISAAMVRMTDKWLSRR